MGVIKSLVNGKAAVALRNNLKIGDTVEFLSTGLENRPYTVSELLNEKGMPVESGRNDQIVFLTVLKGVHENDLIRRPIAS